MDQDYKHTQIGYLMIYVIGSAVAIEIIFLAGFPLSLELPIEIFPVIGLGVIASLTFCLLLFYKLVVEIKDGFLKFRFGLGLIRKKIHLDDIISAKPVRNRWWFGWGIHCTGNGWLYNVSGLDAVEIQMQSGKKMRIGTDQPKKLAEAINNATTKTETPSFSGRKK